MSDADSESASRKPLSLTASDESDSESAKPPSHGGLLPVSGRDAATLIRYIYTVDEARMESSPILAAPLGEPLDVPSFASSLASSCDVSPLAAAHLASLFSDAAIAAFRLRCSRSSLEAFVCALAAAVRADMASWPRSASASFADFRADMLALSVERPPHARGLLDPLQASGAVDFALRAYYAHFSLFKATCARTPRLELSQRSAAGVEPPGPPPPLASAVLSKIIE